MADRDILEELLSLSALQPPVPEAPIPDLLGQQYEPPPAVPPVVEYEDPGIEYAPPPAVGYAPPAVPVAPPPGPPEVPIAAEVPGEAAELASPPALLPPPIAALAPAAAAMAGPLAAPLAGAAGMIGSIGAARHTLGEAVSTALTPKAPTWNDRQISREIDDPQLTKIRAAYKAAPTGASNLLADAGKKRVKELDRERRVEAFGPDPWTLERMKAQKSEPGGWGSFLGERGVSRDDTAGRQAAIEAERAEKHAGALAESGVFHPFHSGLMREGSQATLGRMPDFVNYISNVRWKKGKLQGVDLQQLVDLAGVSGMIGYYNTFALSRLATFAKDDDHYAAMLGDPDVQNFLRAHKGDDLDPKPDTNERVNEELKMLHPFIKDYLVKGWLKAHPGDATALRDYNVEFSEVEQKEVKRPTGRLLSEKEWANKHGHELLEFVRGSGANVFDVTVNYWDNPEVVQRAIEAAPRIMLPQMQAEAIRRGDGITAQLAQKRFAKEYQPPDITWGDALQNLPRSLGHVALGISSLFYTLMGGGAGRGLADLYIGATEGDWDYVMERNDDFLEGMEAMGEGLKMIPQNMWALTGGIGMPEELFKESWRIYKQEPAMIFLDVAAMAWGAFRVGGMMRGAVVGKAEDVATRLVQGWKGGGAYYHDLVQIQGLTTKIANAGSDWILKLPETRLKKIQRQLDEGRVSILDDLADIATVSDEKTRAAAIVELKAKMEALKKKGFDATGLDELAMHIDDLATIDNSLMQTTLALAHLARSPSSSPLMKGILDGIKQRAARPSELRTTVLQPLREYLSGLTPGEQKASMAALQGAMDYAKELGVPPTQVIQVGVGIATGKFDVGAAVGATLKTPFDEATTNLIRTVQEVADVKPTAGMIEMANAAAKVDVPLGQKPAAAALSDRLFAELARKVDDGTVTLPPIPEGMTPESFMQAVVLQSVADETMGARFTGAMTEIPLTKNRIVKGPDGKGRREITQANVEGVIWTSDDFTHHPTSQYFDMRNLSPARKGTTRLYRAEGPLKHGDVFGEEGPRSGLTWREWDGEYYSTDPKYVVDTYWNAYGKGEAKLSYIDVPDDFLVGKEIKTASSQLYKDGYKPVDELDDLGLSLYEFRKRHGADVDTPMHHMGEYKFDREAAAREYRGRVGPEFTGELTEFARIYDNIGESMPGLSEEAKRQVALGTMGNLKTKMQFKDPKFATETFPLIHPRTGEVTNITGAQLLDDIGDIFLPLTQDAFETGMLGMDAGMFSLDLMKKRSLEYLHDIVNGFGGKKLVNSTGVKKFLDEAMDGADKIERTKQMDELLKIETKRQAGKPPGGNILKDIPEYISMVIGKDGISAMQMRWLYDQWKFRVPGRDPIASGRAGRAAAQKTHKFGPSALQEIGTQSALVKATARGIMHMAGHGDEVARVITDLISNPNITQQTATYLKRRFGIDASRLPSDPAARLVETLRVLRQAQTVAARHMPEAIRNILADLGWKPAADVLQEIAPGALKYMKENEVLLAPDNYMLMKNMKTGMKKGGSRRKRLNRFLTKKFKEHKILYEVAPWVRDEMNNRFVVYPMGGGNPWSESWELSSKALLTDNSFVQWARSKGLLDTMVDVEIGGSAIEGFEGIAAFRDRVHHALNSISTPKRPMNIAEPLANMVDAVQRAGKFTKDVAVGTAKVLNPIPWPGMNIGDTAMGQLFRYERGMVDGRARMAQLITDMVKAAQDMARADPTTEAVFRAWAKNIGVKGDPLVGSHEKILTAMNRSTAKKAKGWKGKTRRDSRQAKGVAMGNHLTGMMDELHSMIPVNKMDEMVKFAMDHYVNYKDVSRLADTMSSSMFLSPFFKYPAQMMPRMAQWMLRNPVKARASLELNRASHAMMWSLVGGEGKWSEAQQNYQHKWQDLLPMFPAMQWQTGIEEVPSVYGIAGRDMIWESAWGGGPDVAAPFASPGFEFFRGAVGAVKGLWGDVEPPRDMFPMDFSQGPIPQPGGAPKWDRTATGLEKFGQVFGALTDPWRNAFTTPLPAREPTGWRVSPTMRAGLESLRGAPESRLRAPFELGIQRGVGNKLMPYDKATMELIMAKPGLLAMQRYKEEQGMGGSGRKSDWLTPAFNALFTESRKLTNAKKAMMGGEIDRRTQGINPDYGKEPAVWARRIELWTLTQKEKRRELKGYLGAMLHAFVQRVNHPKQAKYVVQVDGEMLSAIQDVLEGPMMDFMMAAEESYMAGDDAKVDWGRLWKPLVEVTGLPYDATSLDVKRIYKDVDYSDMRRKESSIFRALTRGAGSMERNDDFLEGVRALDKAAQKVEEQQEEKRGAMRVAPWSFTGAPVEDPEIDTSTIKGQRKRTKRMKESIQREEARKANEELRALEELMPNLRRLR